MSTRNALDMAVFGTHQGLAGHPPAGDNLQIGPVSRARSELVALSFDFVTTAAAVDRQVILEISTGFYEVQIAASLVLQPANERYYYIMGIGLTSSTAVVDKHVLIALPPGIVVGHTWHWNLEVLNIQLTDRFGFVYIHEKYWVFEE